MKMKLLSGGLLLVVLGLSWIACTSNPFFDDDEIRSAQLSGRLRLEGSDLPDSALVWLEGLNVYDYTDAAGDFALLLPAPETQGVGGGANGTYNLFFYVGNYYIQTLPIQLVEGRVKTNQKLVRDNGKLRQTIQLTKCLAITTTIEPETLTTTSGGTVRISLNLHAMQDSVTYWSLIWNEPIGATTRLHHAGQYLKACPPGDSRAQFFYNQQCFPYISGVPGGDTKRLSEELTIQPGQLSAGRYLVWHVFYVLDDAIPSNISAFYGNLTQFSEDPQFIEKYLRQPLKQQTALLTVLP